MVMSLFFYVGDFLFWYMSSNFLIISAESFTFTVAQVYNAS